MWEEEGQCRSNEFSAIFFATTTTAERKIGLEKKREIAKKKYQEAENYFESTFKGEKLFVVWDSPRGGGKTQTFSPLSLSKQRNFPTFGL